MIPKGEFLSALFLAGLGFAFCAGAFTLGIGSPANPGEGFMILIPGGALLLLSLVFVIRLVRRRKSLGDTKPFWPEKGSRFRVAAVFISIVIYTLVFETVGFAVATFLLFLFLLKTIDPVTWRSALLISMATTIVGFLLFQVWLQVQLPEGWISWWRLSKWIF